MGRRIPVGDDRLLHPILSLSLIVAGLAEIIAITTTLCGVRFLRRLSPDSSSSKEQEKLDSTPPQTTTETIMTPPPPQAATTSTETEEKTENGNDDEAPQIKQLPLPPAMQQVMETNDAGNYRMKKSASTRSLSLRLSTNLSMKLPRSLSMARGRDRVEETHQRKKGKEDSIWMKTIILGEKCKVPQEEDTIIYDGKGNRISTFHSKNPNYLPLSRANSYIDPTAVPRQDHKERRVTINGEDECISSSG